MSRLPGLLGRIMGRQRQAAPFPPPVKRGKTALLAEARRLGLKLPRRATAAEIEAAISQHNA